jgi:RNA polymerase sigma-70 factor (ECF subfamily)
MFVWSLLRHPGPTVPVLPAAWTEWTWTSFPESDVSEDSAVDQQASKPDDANAADAALVLAVASGDRKALAALYDRHGSAMLGLGVRVLRNRRDAEDVLHDVFLEVWRRAHTYDRTRASVRGWLFLMMRSRSLDRRKSAAFSLSTSLEVTGLDAVASKASSLGSTGASGEAPLLALDHKRAVEALSRLPEAQQHVVILGYFEGLSSSEIAAELDVPIGTVKSRVAAAMRALRDSLGVVESTSGTEQEKA